jgi:DNA-binding CsgD family transcriptional regulator
VLIGAGEITSFVGNLAESERLLEEALTRCRALGEAGALVVTLWNLAHVECWAGRYARAEALAEEGLALTLEIGLLSQVGQLLYVLAAVADSTQRYAAARDLARRCLEAQHGIGYERGVAVALQTLGRAYYHLGDVRTARVSVEASIENFRGSQYPYGEAWSLLTLGWIATDERKYGQARACLVHALATFRELGADARVGETLDAFAQLAQAEGRPSTAFRLAGAASVLHERAGMPLSPAARAMLEPRLARARSDLGSVEAESAWVAGRRLSVEGAVAEALAGVTSVAAPARSVLTQREHEVARLVARGLTSRQIAEHLVITTRTAETHVERIYTKLDLHSRAQLATWVVSTEAERAVARLATI